MQNASLTKRTNFQEKRTNRTQLLTVIVNQYTKANETNIYLIQHQHRKRQNAITLKLRTTHIRHNRRTFIICLRKYHYYIEQRVFNVSIYFVCLIIS